MGKLTVLHLSDLHLTSDNSLMSQTERDKFRDELIKKINDYKKDVAPIDIVAITGDTIDKGKVNGYSNYAKKFFKAISDATGLVSEKFIFVPGNHDIDRMDMLNGRIPVNNDELIKVYLPRFDEFKKFSSAFVNNGRGRRGNSNACFGVRDIDFAGQTARFIMINSAIFFDTKGDYAKILITNYQLEQLATDYNSKKVKPDITIALMHHPMDWLNPIHKQDLMQYFKDTLCVDVLLHGHTHEGSVYGNISPDYGILSLVSGVGYPEKSKRTGSGYKITNDFRIAFYTFSTDEETVEGYLYVTKDGFAFRPDTERYQAVSNDGQFKITYKPSFSPKSAHDLSAQLDSAIREKSKIQLDVDDLQRLICNGKKFTENKAKVFFDEENQKYDFSFVKQYQVISDNIKWYSGQIYLNTLPQDPQRSREFYGTESVRDSISWEHLGFNACINCVDCNGTEKYINLPVKCECVAESANYKTFNIYYEGIGTSGILDIQKGDVITLFYSYSVPVLYWGSYLNRTISYFKEATSVILSGSQKGLLKDDYFYVVKRSSDKREEDVILNSVNFEKQEDGKSYCVQLPNECAQFAVFWDAESIFELDGINTPLSRDNCQITST